METSMPIWVDFLASIFEATTVYLLVLLLSKNNRIGYLQLSVLVVMIAVLAVALGVLNVPYRFVFTICCYVFLMKWMSHQKTTHLVVDVIIAHAFYIAMQFAATILIGIVHGNILGNYTLLFFMLTLFLFVAAIMNKIRAVKIFVERRYANNRDIAIWISTNLLIVSIFMLDIWNNNQAIFWAEQWKLTILLTVNYALNIILLISFLKRKQEKNKGDAYREYSEHLEELKEQLSEEQHEYKHQINAIIGLARTCPPQECAVAIISYSEQILNNKKKEGSNKIVGGDKMIKAMLIQKTELAQRHHIKFTHSLLMPFPDYPMTSVDIVGLLSNLIDNAFEAVLELPEEDREVSLDLKSNRIQVLNSISKDFDDGGIYLFKKKGYSTKGENRGYGLSNVRRIVDKYQYTLDIYVNNCVLMVQISVT